MRIALLGAVALLVPAVAYADGDAAMAEGWVVGAQGGWTTMDMPAHGNGAVEFDQGGGVFKPLTTQTSVDGASFRVGAGKETSSGWRFGALGKFFDGHGETTESFIIRGGPLFRVGNIVGSPILTAFASDATLIDQSLNVDVNSKSVAGSVGRKLFDRLYADLVVSYETGETHYRNQELFNANRLTTNTSFAVKTVEFGARVSTKLQLSDTLSFGIGATGGYGLRQIDMTAGQLRVDELDVVRDSRSITENNDVSGFLGHVDAALDFAASHSIVIGLTANYDYDSMVPAYVPPVQGTVPGAPSSKRATFTTEGESTMTYGVRVIGHF